MEKDELWNQIFKIWPEATKYQSTPVFPVRRWLKRR
jgi:hypothetical protein